jgi:DNA-binding CsgD family transcriptional regulator
MQFENTVLRLINAVYEAAEKPEIWPDVLKSVGDAVASLANCFTIENISHNTSCVSVFSKIDPSFQQAYNDYYGQINPHITRARTPLIAGQFVSGHTICGDEELVASEYYQDFLRPQGWFYPFGACVSRDHPFIAALSFFHSRSQGPCTEEQQNLIELLVPHFRRAVKLQTLVGTVGEAALESIPTAVILTDSRCKVHFANHAARRILQKRNGLGIASGGNLECSPSVRQPFLNFVYETSQCREKCGLKAGGFVSIPRSAGKRPYGVTASPIHYSNPLPAANRPTVILIISDPDCEVEGVEAATRRLYGLTASEAKLAQILVSGKSLNDACDEMQIQRTTARTHLRNLFGKLGVRRQAELVSVLMRSFAQKPAS